MVPFMVKYRERESEREIVCLIIKGTIHYHRCVENIFDVKIVFRGGKYPIYTILCGYTDHVCSKYGFSDKIWDLIFPPPIFSKKFTLSHTHIWTTPIPHQLLVYEKKSSFLETMYLIDLVYQFSGHIDIGYLKIHRGVLGLSHTHSPPKLNQKVNLNLDLPKFPSLVPL